jgi:tRNA(Ile2) C34 agmatinyltransferase TiaS
MRVANALTEEEVEVEQDEVLAVVVVDDGKVACDVCGKRYKASGLNTHKAVHKKNK